MHIELAMYPRNGKLQKIVGTVSPWYQCCQPGVGEETGLVNSHSSRGQEVKGMSEVGASWRVSMYHLKAFKIF